MTEPAVDVVVLAHDGLADQVRGLLSGGNRTPFELIVVGSSPDLMDAQEVTLVERDWPSARAEVLAMHTDRDVVLLAPEVKPFGDWLDRLRAAAESQPDVSRVAPLANGGMAANYPLAGADRAQQLELSGAELDALAARANNGVRVAVDATGEECVYIRRGRQGRHLIAADVVVECGQPAQPTPSTPGPNAPAHAPRQLRFSEPGPLSAARLALDVARLDRALGGQARFLFVTHNWGGGTERHIRDLRDALEREGVAVLLCRPDPDDRQVIRFESPVFTPNLPIVRLGDEQQFAEALRLLRIDRVHIHSLVGYDPTAAHFFADAIAVPYDVTVHDGQSVCPRITLIGITDVYCGEPVEQSCQRCIDHLGSPFGEVAITQWRQDQAHLLAGARSVIAPSRDLATRVERHLPGVSVRTQPHPEPAAPRRYLPVQRDPGRYRVGVLGKIGPPKGAELVKKVAEVCEREHPDVEFRVLGLFDARLAMPSMPNVHVTGRYDDDRLLELIVQQQLDLIWFPAIVPESYSYTLTVALRTPLPIVAFDFGAIAERLRDVRRGTLMDPKLMFAPDAVARALRLACDGHSETPIEPPPPPASYLRDYYRL